jgi:EmrB/QacA subfamily drug resistance transporter
MIRRIEYKWLVAAVYVVALFLDFLDTTVVNVALPTLGREFEVNATSIEWIVTAYLLGLAVFIPVSGWMGDRFGTKRTFLAALALFTLSSALCATAWSIESLIAFRALQGAAGGLLTPVGGAMLYRVFPPEERARAASVITVPTVVAPTLGPLIGGYLVGYQSWHWIFLVNIPIGLIGFAIAARVLREYREDNPGRFDLPGFLFGATGLASLLYALSQVGPRGAGDNRVVGFGLIGLLLSAAFIVVELRISQPMIELRLYRDRLFAAGNAILFFSQAVFVGVIFLLPLLVQAELGYSPFHSGLVLFPTALGVVMVTPITTRLYSRVGPRRLLAVGMILSSLSSLALRLIGPDSSEWSIRGLMLPRGWAFGVTLIPLQAIAFATISRAQTGRATAAFSVVRQIAASFGVALLVTVLSNRLAYHDAVLGNPATQAAAISAFDDTFVVAALLGVFGLAATFLVDDRLAARTRRLASAPAEATRVPAIGDD